MPACRNLPLPQIVATLFERTLSELMEFLEQTEFDDLRATHFLNVFLHLQIEGKRSGELARLAGMTPQAMGELIDHLEQRGYVKRVPDSRDRRAKLVMYDKRGFQASADLSEFYSTLEAEWTTILGKETAEHVQAGLKRLITASDPASPGSGPIAPR